MAVGGIDAPEAFDQISGREYEELTEKMSK